MGIIFAFIYQYFLRYYLNISDKFIEKMENSCCCNWMLKITGFISVSHITNKFMDEKLNQRISGQILNLNKPSGKKKDKNGEGQKSIQVPSEYTNRTENSIMSNAIPPTLIETSFEENKSNP